MDPRRAETERNMIPSVGATFYREDGEVRFQFVIDTANIIGPRPASRADQAAHPAAWSAFCAAEKVGVLDRDAAGGSGGSLPAESPAVAVQKTPRVPPEFDEPVIEEVPGPGGIADGLLHSDPPTETPKAKRKYTRRKKG